MRPLSFALVAVWLLTIVVEGVDRSKFKTCEQSSFCRRNRRLSNPETTETGPVFKVVPETIRIAMDSFSVDIDAGEGRLLSMGVSGLASGVLRARFREKGMESKRYEVSESLIPMKQARVVYKPKKQSISVGKESTLVLHFDPFQLDFHNGKGDLVISMNKRHLFNWEFYRARPAEMPEDIDGEWDEKFGTHEDHKPNGPTSVAMDASFIGVEHVYGIPSHAANFSLPSTRGEKKRYDDPFRMYNLDVFEYEIDNPMALYGHVPFMVGHSAEHTSAMLWLNAAETWIDVDSTSEPGNVATHWISESGIIDLFLLPGPTPKAIMEQYATLTGTGELPPRFAISYHQCKWNYKSELEISELDANFDKYEIAYDVSWLDIEHTDGKRYFTWDKAHFPTPTRMLDEVAAKGRRMVTIVDPHLKRDTGYSVHQSAQSGKHYIKDHKGNEYDGWCWPGSSSWPDFLEKSVRDWWASLFAYDKYVGSTSSLFTWNDMNEPSVFNGPEVTMHKDALHLSGFEHRDVHNLYGMGIHMATVQGQIERDEDKNRRPFVLSRAFFAGTQRYGAIWTGDNAGEWSHLRASTPMLLSLGMSGISFAGADVGGFFGNPDGELLARWYQLGAMQPFFRAHAHLDSKRREPWIFDEPYLSAMRQAVRTRYALLPYIYGVFREASVNGSPVVRPLFYEFPSEPKFFAEETQFMLGSALMVSPVTEPGVTTVTVAFPSGKWYRYDTLAVAADGTEEAPMERGVPAWLRGGSIVPRQERVRRSSHQMRRDPITLVIALDEQQRASGSLYWDDGETFDYTRGQSLECGFVFENSQLSSNLVQREGVYKSGLVVERLVIVGLATPPNQVKTASGKSLSFNVHDGIVTVRKPELSIDEEWKVSF